MLSFRISVKIRARQSPAQQKAKALVTLVDDIHDNTSRDLSRRKTIAFHVEGTHRGFVRDRSDCLFVSQMTGEQTSLSTRYDLRCRSLSELARLADSAPRATKVRVSSVNA